MSVFLYFSLYKYYSIYKGEQRLFLLLENISKGALRMKKLLKTIRYILFFFSLSLSLFIFCFYMISVLDNNTYYMSSNIEKTQSQEIKDLIGLSKFASIKIEGFKYNSTFYYDTKRYIYFDITISYDDYISFIKYIEEGQDQPLEVQHPHFYVIEESLTNLTDSSYKMQIMYVTIGWNDIHYLEGNQRYSSEVWYLLPAFFSIILVNSLIILPYKKIYRFLFTKKASP